MKTKVNLIKSREKENASINLFFIIFIFLFIINSIFLSKTPEITTKTILLKTQNPYVGSQNTKEVKILIKTYSKEEAILLEQIVAAEGFVGIWTEEEFLSIATIVMNRVESSLYPNTITEVIKEPKQFEAYRNGRYLEVSIPQEVKNAVTRVLSGERNLEPDVFSFCTEEYYLTESPSDYFHSLKFNTKIKNTMFFKNK